VGCNRAERKSESIHESDVNYESLCENLRTHTDSTMSGKRNFKCCEKTSPKRKCRNALGHSFMHQTTTECTVNAVRLGHSWPLRHQRSIPSRLIVHKTRSISFWPFIARQKHALASACLPISEDSDGRMFSAR
jgi:hypothetical protein